LNPSALTSYRFFGFGCLPFSAAVQQPFWLFAVGCCCTTTVYGCRLLLPYWLLVVTETIFGDRFSLLLLRGHAKTYVICLSYK
jgi:hypothetical protein